MNGVSGDCGSENVGDTGVDGTVETGEVGSVDGFSPVSICNGSFRFGDGGSEDLLGVGGEFSSRLSGDWGRPIGVVTGAGVATGGGRDGGPCGFLFFSFLPLSLQIIISSRRKSLCSFNQKKLRLFTLDMSLHSPRMKSKN